MSETISTPDKTTYEGSDDFDIARTAKHIAFAEQNLTKRNNAIQNLDTIHRNEIKRLEGEVSKYLLPEAVGFDIESDGGPVKAHEISGEEKVVDPNKEFVEAIGWNDERLTDGVAPQHGFDEFMNESKK